MGWAEYQRQMQSKGTQSYVLSLKSYKIGFRTRILNGINIINFILINDRMHYKGNTVKNVNVSK